ncbi:MAG TPA: hypothetical protein PKD49_14355 [Hyphomicrobium sp.]|nr:hypothetical protein [Hyphomicrobium sp.]
MSRSTPPPWPGSPQDYPPSFNGSTFEVGLLLGEFRTEGRRQTEILLSILDEQRELPDKLAAKMGTGGGLREAKSPGPDRISPWSELITALAPLMLLVAVVTGKLSAPDALPLVRHILGLG